MKLVQIRIANVARLVNDNAEGLVMRVYPKLVWALVDVETDSDDSEDEKNAAASGGGRRCKNQEA